MIGVAGRETCQFLTEIMHALEGYNSLQVLRIFKIPHLYIGYYRTNWKQKENGYRFKRCNK